MAAAVSPPPITAAAAVPASSNEPQKQPREGQSSLSSSPRQYPTDLTCLEEGDETESETPNEPITPVSGRQSQDFHQLQSHDNHDNPSDANSHHPLAAELPASATFSSLETVVAAPASKPPLILNTAATPPPFSPGSESSSAYPPATPLTADPDAAPTPLSRRSTRGSTSSFKRTMSSLFRRSNSQSDRAAFGLEASHNAASESNLPEASQRREPSRRWSMNKSSNTTRSNTPPSPGSPPLEMRAPAHPPQKEAATSTLAAPNPDDLFINNQKKSRASTGFSLRSRAIQFVGGGAQANGEPAKQPPRPARRRASSFDFSKQVPPPAVTPNDPIEMDRSLLAFSPDAGTGVKARRMSLSLPDDLFVDVAELLSEFEYQSKFLGRHGKHVGKGATSKVTLMTRKGFPTELYAVKEFRGKNSRESTDEYEKKIKSEFTLAKSLHHPNIVETIRLCTDHGRWNHVMEYCAEGDLFTLVKTKYLKKSMSPDQRDDREKDRLCLFKQLVQGVNYLHSNGVAHRDIKLENLLITSDSKLKITDFGVSDVFSGIHPGLREAGGQCGRNMSGVRLCAPGICGSVPFIAPEVLAKAGKYDPRGLDVWSSGIVMLNLIFGGNIWNRADEKTGNYANLVSGWAKWEDRHSRGSGAPLAQTTTAGSDNLLAQTSTASSNESSAAASTVPAITDTDYPKVTAFDVMVNPPALRRLLLQMLHPNPDRRITIAEVVKNRWFKNIECCQLESYDDPARLIDASKGLGGGRTRKIFCHNHLPSKEHGHTLPPMPGKPNY